MASACVNNIGMSPENLLDCPPTTYSSYGWLSPRISINREFSDNDPSEIAGSQPSSPPKKPADPSDVSHPEPMAGDFEFCLEDPVTMLPADKLFSDGKLVPLHLSAVKLSVNEKAFSETWPQMETDKPGRRIEIDGTDPCVFSPKAPRCASRWRDLLGLKKLCNANANKCESQKTTSSLSSSSSNTSKSLKLFLHRSSKISSSLSDASLSLPLLKDSECESVSISSRLSLSSSSSGHELDDLPRLSLDVEKQNANPIFLHRNQNNPNPPKMRMVRPRAAASMSSETNQKSLIDHHTAVRMGRSPVRRAPGESSGVASRGASVDSPRMSSSGKIVFHSLERSSSSPSTFNGGPRHKHRGMERSYSANVRVTPVLNVPVCSLRGSSKSGSVFGFGPLFSSQQKREGNGSGVGSNRSHGYCQLSNSRHRTDRN